MFYEQINPKIFPYFIILAGILKNLLIFHFIGSVFTKISVFVFPGPRPQFVFGGSGPIFVFHGLGSQFAFTGPGTKFVFACSSFYS